MPSPTAVRASERGVEVQSGNPVSTPVSSAAIDLLHGPDPSVHMLGLPKAYPQLGRWVALAILAGAIAAFIIVGLTSQ
jgi:hypothetical protein